MSGQLWVTALCSWPGLQVDRPDDSQVNIGVTRIDVGFGLTLRPVAAGHVLIDWAGGGAAQVFVTNVLQSFFTTNVVQTTSVLNVTNVLNVPSYDPSTWTLPQLCGAGLFGLLSYGGVVGILWPGCSWQVLCSDCQPVQGFVPQPPPPVPLPPVLPPPPPGPTFGGPPPPQPPPPAGTLSCVDVFTGAAFDFPKTLCLTAAGFSAPAGEPDFPWIGSCFWGKGYQALNGTWPLSYEIMAAIGTHPWIDAFDPAAPCLLNWGSPVAYPITAVNGPAGFTGQFVWLASRGDDGRWYATFESVDPTGGFFGGMSGGMSTGGWRSDVGPPTLPATLHLYGVPPGDCCNFPATLTLSAGPCAPSSPGTSGPGTPGGPPPAPPQPCSCCGPGGTVPSVLDVTLQAQVAAGGGTWQTLLPSFPVIAGPVPNVPGVPGLPQWDCPAWSAGDVTLDGGAVLAWAVLVCLGGDLVGGTAPFSLWFSLAGDPDPSRELDPLPDDPAPLPAPCAPGSTLTLGGVQQGVTVDGTAIGLTPGVLYVLRAVVTGY